MNLRIAGNFFCLGIFVGLFSFFVLPLEMQAAVLSDTFNDTNGLALSSHTSDSGHTWSKASNWSAGEVTIYNSGSGTHTIYSSTAQPAILYLSNWTPAGTDYSISAPLSFLTDVGDNPGVFLRASSDGKYGYIVIYNRVSHAFQVYKELNGVLGTAVASYNYAWASGSPTFVAKVVGVSTPIITVTVNGTDVITYTDTTPSAQLQVGGQAGIWFSGSAAVNGTTGVHIISVTTADIVEIVPLSISSISLTSATPTTFNLSVTASNGTLSYSYQWYRSSTGGFTAGSTYAIAGATNSTLSDTPPSNGPWFYRAVVTDTGNSTATTSILGLTLQNPTITNNSVVDSMSSNFSILAIGDSITYGNGLSAGQDPPSKMDTALTSMYGTRSVNVLNRGHSGSKTADWLSGAGSGYLNTAISAAQSASPAATVAIIMLGANDAATSNHVSSTTYISNISSIISSLLSNGFTKVIINYPTYIPAGANSNATDETATNLTNQYMAKLDTIVNGTTIVAGDKVAYGYFQDYLTSLQADQTHPNANGALALGNMWATATAKAIGLSLTATTSISGQANVASASTTLMLENWASIGTQTITLTSSNSSDTFVTSNGYSGTGSVVVTMATGTSLFSYKITRSSIGTSNITVTNAQNWTNPSTLVYTVPDDVAPTPTPTPTPTPEPTVTPTVQTSSSGSYSRYYANLYRLPNYSNLLTQNVQTTNYIDRDLSIGNTGDDVRRLQEILIKGGYLDEGNNTGYFGPLTKNALATYQLEHGIYPASGNFGPLTRASIFNVNKSNTDNVGKKYLAGTLEFGSVGDEVRTLQRILASISSIYPEGVISGYFGEKTLSAVKKFQLEYKVILSEQDAGYGVVGPKTRSKLNEFVK
jgi:peptidoglycan hydrolase-like protein with peptidoglycan-binding domain/lysophospholipase L1-like esterase